MNVMDIKIDKLKLCYKIKENGLIQKIRNKRYEKF